VTPPDADSATTGVFLYVNDVDAHYAAAEAAGAESCTAEGRPLRPNLFDARPRGTSLVLHITAEGELNVGVKLVSRNGIPERSSPNAISDLSRRALNTVRGTRTLSSPS
jgi:hypothetical protein